MASCESFLARRLKNICANCMVYGWKQEAKNKVTLRCTGCKIFYYCGRECQEEHWKKTHRQHCTALSQLSSHTHDKANCKYCILQTSAGSKVTKSNNPNYICLVANKWLKSQSALELEVISSVTSDPDDLLERLFLITQRLELKRVVTGLADSDTPILGNLQSQRLKIYLDRLTNPKKINDNFRSSEVPEGNNRSDDVFQILETIRALNSMACIVTLIRRDQMLKRPEKSLPAEWRQTSRDIRKGHLLKKIRQILEALEDQVVPHRQLVEIVCEGNVEQNCRVCKKTVTVTKISNTYHFDSAGKVCVRSAFAYILPYEATGFMICCGSVECQTAVQESDPVATWMAALASTLTRLRDTR